MPIYEYECCECGHHTEVLQKFSDKPLAECEICRGKVKKLISQSTFHLKGTGWYVTDYAKSGGNQGGSASSEVKSSTAETKTSTSESKTKDTPSAAKKD